MYQMGKLESGSEGRFEGILDKFSLKGRVRQLVGAALLAVSAGGAMADKAELKVPVNNSGNPKVVFSVGCDANEKDLPVASTRIACEDITNPSVLEAVQQYVDRVGQQAFRVEDCKDHLERGDDGKIIRDSVPDFKACKDVDLAVTIAESERLKEEDSRLAQIEAESQASVADRKNDIAEGNEEEAKQDKKIGNLEAALIAFSQ